MPDGPDSTRLQMMGPYARWSGFYFNGPLGDRTLHWPIRYSVCRDRSPNGPDIIIIFQVLGPYAKRSGFYFNGPLGDRTLHLIDPTSSIHENPIHPKPSIYNVDNIDPEQNTRKSLHLEHFDYSDPGYAYFITICTLNKSNYFANSQIAQIIADQLDYRRKHGEIKLYCYCIMPDHIHLLLSLDILYKKSLQTWVSAFKRYVSNITKKRFKIKDLWQKDFFDHIVRREESLMKIAEYIVKNPARKGMGDDWEDYPFCWVVEDFSL